MARLFVRTLALVAAAILVGCSPGETTDRKPAAAESLDTQKFAVSRSIEETPRTLSIPYAGSILNTGKPVRARDYKWQVAIQVGHGKGWRCGGVLISRSYVLTAAHCVDAASAKDFSKIVRVDQAKIGVFHGGDKFGDGARLALDPTWAIRFHPKWKTTGQAFAWDAAILKLARPVGDAVPAPARTVALSGGQAVTSGWGAYDATDAPSLFLRAVEVPLVSNAVCRASMPGSLADDVGDFTLCAASRTDDACSRDSGGPLVIGSADQPQTVGIVSWGPSGACGQPNADGVLVGAYTRISAIAPWIASQTGDPATVTNRVAGPLIVIRPRDDI